MARRQGLPSCKWRGANLLGNRFLPKQQKDQPLKWTDSLSSQPPFPPWGETKCDYISQVLKAVRKQPAGFGPQVYFGTSPAQGSWHSSVCLDPEARNEGANSVHQPLDPSLPTLSASLTVDRTLHKLPYPNNHWRPTPITAQQETVPPMGSKRIPMPCRNGVYISNIRWEYSKAIMTCQLRLTSALNIRTQIALQVHQESIRAMLDVWWSTLHCSYFLPRSAGKQNRSLGISEFSWNMLPDYL